MSSPWIGLNIIKSIPSNVPAIDEDELALRIPCSDCKCLFFSIDRVKRIYKSISDLPELSSEMIILDGPVIYKRGTPLGRCRICGERGPNTKYIQFQQNISKGVETWIHEGCCEEFLELIEEELEKHSDELVADYL